MNVIKNGTITDVKGFKAAGITAGLKKSGKKDLALIYSEYKAVSAAVFTKNLVKAAPILVDMENIKSENTQAIIVNSGNANACTGEDGYKNAKKMTEIIAEKLNLHPTEVLVESTGIIGVQMDMEKVASGLEKIVPELSEEGGHNAGEAIMTTDTFPKNLAVKIEIGGKEVTIAGIAKGSGMIHPDMATMLAFLVTDISIDKKLLQKVFSKSTDDSYNMVSVDGDTSTNDMAGILANGAAGNTKITDENSEEFKIFKEALNFVNKELAKSIAKDGEGATKLIEVTTKNARTMEDAKKVSKSVITSSLFKAAVFGSDANWGRILCAVGYSGAELIVDKIEIFIKGEDKIIQVAKNGMGIDFGEEEVEKILKEEKVGVIVNLNDGNYDATAWGCDLTYDYVKINADYRT
ncbi:Arginine biosynthesis bifunctional protein ArgJ [Sebaldella termitidis]|uniref:Arginine biosynthesis bifunctional protein ArgJ n=1 Tax=Sebaldella termitidis (strain ATCC 33386 / NCTC 11300) TaxID=526218 RepID=D1AJ74_SEBTE|nr:bifunctional glutamate N-acetyltransferase/amino-acid acetyltransferase ArgJ [Sebaldella termitidis]ACZ08762.1 arginine biosynthesis bifunctional protein ArgJ [Sebaldella termitidis ATCC 33386]SUI24079.1 Arginine biosynthesis bifunctional protein ArgJ [Sebaldella termitidis]